jgi:hypothetical protein
MSPAELQSLMDAIILLIVALSGAITAYTHWKVSQIPNKAETMTVATQLQQSNGHLEAAVQELTAKLRAK